MMGRGRSLVLAVVVAVLVGLTPGTAFAAQPPAIPGTLANATEGFGDGVKLFLRHDGLRFYAVHVNVREGTVWASKRHGLADAEHAYTQLSSRQPRPVRWDQRQRVVASAVDLPGGSVRIRLWVDDELWLDVTDHGAVGPPLRAGSIGLRSDSAEWSIDDLEVHRAGADGRATGTRLLVDRFDYPDGLVTNQHLRSPKNRIWRVTSGSLFARDGRGWSGVPDWLPDLRSPNPESRWHTGSSVFRMVTHRADLTDVAVSLDLWTHGVVTAASQTPAPRPPAYLGAGSEVTVRRNAGRSKVHTAIAVSQRAFARSPHAVLVHDDPSAAHLAAPALAGRLDAPLLLTAPGALNRDTAAELQRLRVRTVHIVGPMPSSMDAALRQAGVTTIRRLSGANGAATAALVAREVGGRHVYLADSAAWRDATGSSGAAAALPRPVLLVSAATIPSVTRSALRDLGVTRVTILGTSVEAALVDDLRAEGYRVDHGGFSRYSISRFAAQQQVAAGGSRARVWVAAGARPTDALVIGPAAARNGGIALTLDGTQVDDTSAADLARRGFESRHWQRYERRHLRTLQVAGDTSAVSGAVVRALTAPVPVTPRSIAAACRRSPQRSFPDLTPGSTLARAAGCLAAWNVTHGSSDGTYAPAGRVTRGQLASFLDRALVEVGIDLADPPSGRFPDLGTSPHRGAVERLAAAGIVAGRPDGRFGPGDPVSRAQMATFLRRSYERAAGRALAVPPTQFRDTATSPHQAAISAVAHVGIAAGTSPGTYRPGHDVTRGQMASFLARWLDLAVTDGLATGPR